MTTTTNTTVIDHTSTAGFRAWGLEFSTSLAAVGLVQTADTGQIDWTSVAYSSTGAISGFEMWSFADSTIYIKFEYGTDTNGAGYPVIYMTCGTGSDGAGTVTGTGQISSRARITPNQLPASTVTTYTSYYSRTSGHLAILWKQLGFNSAQALGFAVVGKTVDSTGADTTTGYGLLRSESVGSVTIQSVRLIATAQVFSDSTFFAIVPGVPTTSLDDAGNFQAYMINLNVPKVLPFMYANIVNLLDIPKGTTFSVAQVGSTPRTYLSVGPQNSSPGGLSSGGYGFLFE